MIRGREVSQLAGVLCIASAWIFPFYGGAYPDAFQQIYSLGALAAAALLFGMDLTPAFVRMLLAGAIALVALSESTYVGGKAAGIAGLLVLGVSCHLGVRIQRESTSLAYVLISLAMAAVINAAEGLLQWFGLVSALGPWVVEPEKRGIAFGTFRQPNLFATFLCIGLVCVVWLKHLRWLSAAMAWFLTIVLVFGVAVSGSRTGSIGLIVLALTAFLWRRQQPLPLSRLMLGQLGIYGCALLVLPIAASWHGFEFSSAVERFGDSSNYSRQALWSNAVDLVGTRPWTGWGWLEFGYGHFVTDFPQRFNEKVSHAHNLLLQLAVEFGIPVAMIFMATALWAIYSGRPWQVELKSETNLHVAVANRSFAWSILLLIGIHSMLELPLWHLGYLFLTGLCIGFLLPHCHLTDTGKKNFGLQIGFAHLGAAMAIVLALITWQQYAKVYAISKAPFSDRPALRDAVSSASGAWLFQGYLDFVELGLMEVTPENAIEVRRSSEKLLHLSAEPRVIRPLLLSLWMLGEKDALRLQARRFCRAFPLAFLRWRQDYLAHPMGIEIGETDTQCQPFRLQN